MSETPATVADVAELTTPAADAKPAPAVTTETTEKTPIATMADGAGATPAEAAKIEAKWRDDWREAAAGKDEAKAKWLARFASPESVIDAGWQANAKLKAGLLKPAALPENANEAEIASYRKAWGVPDKPEGYEVKPPDGIDFSEPEAESLNTFLADMHANHVPKPIVQKAAESYFKIRQAEEQQLYEAAVESTTNQLAEIRAEYGRDFARNTSLGNAHMVKTLGQEKAAALASLTLANGTKLGDHPDFVRLIVADALGSADDGMLVTSEVQSNGGKSIDDQIKEIRDLMFGDDQARAKFHSPETQARYLKLYQIKQARAA